MASDLNLEVITNGTTRRLVLAGSKAHRLIITSLLQFRNYYSAFLKYFFANQTLTETTS